MNSPLASIQNAPFQNQLGSVTRPVGNAGDYSVVLDREFPLREGSHGDALCYAMYYQNLVIHLADGRVTGLKYPSDFVEAHGRKAEPDAIVLRNEQMQAEIEFSNHGEPRQIGMTLRLS